MLVSQFTSAESRDQLAAYWGLQQRLADSLDHVHWVDARQSMEENKGTWLVDRNHLSREGSEMLAGLLIPTLVPLLEEPN